MRIKSIGANNSSSLSFQAAGRFATTPPVTAAPKIIAEVAKSSGYDLETGTAESLHTVLNDAGYFCDDTVSGSIHRAIQNTPVRGAIVYGDTGAGKTYLPEVLSKILNAKLFSYQCQLQTDDTDLISKLIPVEDTVSGIKLQDNIILNAIKASNDGLTVLLIDEYDKTRPSADTIMLEFLQRGGVNYNNVNYQGNLDNLIVFLCCNMERELSDYIMRRMCVIQMHRLSPNIVGMALNRKYKDLENQAVKTAYAMYKALYIKKYSKAVSVQELYAFINAYKREHTITNKVLDNLIYQFITKTVEYHKEAVGILKNVNEIISKEVINKDREQIVNTEALAKIAVKIDNEITAAANINENISPVRKGRNKYNYDFTEEIVIDTTVTGGIFPYKKAVYDRIAKHILATKSTLSKTGKELIVTFLSGQISKFRVGNYNSTSYMEIMTPIQILSVGEKMFLTDLFRALYNAKINGGEIAITFPSMKLEEALAIKGKSNSIVSRIHDLNKDYTLFEYGLYGDNGELISDSIQCRFTETDGVEMIIPIKMTTMIYQPLFKFILEVLLC